MISGYAVINVLMIKQRQNQINPWEILDTHQNLDDQVVNDFLREADLVGL